MDEQLTQTIERLAAAAEGLQHVLARMDAHQEALNTKVDRIVATLDENAERATSSMAVADAQLTARMADLERENAELKAQAARSARKTLSPLASALLSKTAGDAYSFDPATLDKVLAPLSLEQRIAVKAEMARAGMIE